MIGHHTAACQWRASMHVHNHDQCGLSLALPQLRPAAPDVVPEVYPGDQQHGTPICVCQCPTLANLDLLVSLGL